MNFAVASQRAEAMMRTHSASRRTRGREPLRHAEHVVGAVVRGHGRRGRRTDDLGDRRTPGRPNVSPRAFLMPPLRLPRSVSKPLRARPIRIWATGAEPPERPAAAARHSFMIGDHRTRDLTPGRFQSLRCRRPTDRLGFRGADTGRITKVVQI